MIETKLLEELISAGATQKEASELTEFVQTLQKPSLTRSLEFKESQAERLVEKLGKQRNFNIRKLFTPVAIAAASLSVATISAFAAQSSLPGDPLYPVKRLTETVIQTVDPKFQEQLPVRRSAEVESLVQNKKSSTLIKQTIEDLNKSRKQSPVINNKDVQNNLRQAEEKATGETKTEIKKAIEEGKVEGNFIHQDLDKQNHSENKIQENNPLKQDERDSNSQKQNRPN